MKKPNLNKIIADNIDKAKFQSKRQPSLPSDEWMASYLNGGVYLSDRAKATQFGQYQKGGQSDPNQPYHPITNPGGFKPKISIIKDLSTKEYPDTDGNFITKFASKIASNLSNKPVKNPITGKVHSRESDYGGVNDLYNKYFGQPLKTNTVQISKYRPTNESDKSSIYYSVDDPLFKKQIVDEALSMGLKLGENKQARGYQEPSEEYKNLLKKRTFLDRLKEPFYQFGVSPSQNEIALNEAREKDRAKVSKSAAIGGHRVSRGKDEKGEYISYYDSFDYTTGTGSSTAYGTGHPFELYDRIYLDSKGNPIYKMGGGMFPPYHSWAPPRMDDGGDISIPDLNVKDINNMLKNKNMNNYFFNQDGYKMGGGLYAYAEGGNRFSIVDYMASTGRDFSKANRKELAKKYGINNYSGKDYENLFMLKKLQEEDAIEYQKRNQSGIPFQAAQNQPAPSSTMMPMIPMTRSAANKQQAVNQSLPKVKQKETMPNTPPKTVVKNNATTVSKDSGFRPYAPNQPIHGYWPYDNTYNTPNIPAPASKTISGTKGDARYLESGMITDKNKGVMYAVKNGKVVKTFPVMTGLNKDVNENPYSIEYLDKNPMARATPVGTYLSVPKGDIYGRPGYIMNPIPAFGQPAPVAGSKTSVLGQHTLYGNAPKGTHGYDPAEYAKRMKIMAGPGEKRVGSYGCTNMYGQDIDCLTGQLFPKGDTTIVVDSRRAADKNFLKNKYGIKKSGGEPCYECGGMYKDGGDYSGTYYQGTYFGPGGSFVPEFYSPQYGLPEMMYGMGMALGGPTYSDVTAYNHQKYVPAFDWMADGGLVEGGEYDMNENDVQDLINKGYKIEYL